MMHSLGPKSPIEHRGFWRLIDLDEDEEVARGDFDSQTVTGRVSIVKVPVPIPDYETHEPSERIVETMLLRQGHRYRFELATRLTVTSELGVSLGGLGNASDDLELLNGTDGRIEWHNLSVALGGDPNNQAKPSTPPTTEPGPAPTTEVTRPADPCLV